MEPISRRQFVRGLGLSPLALAAAHLAYAVPAEASQRRGIEAPDTPRMRFFDAHQAAVVVAATARLIPGPTDDPLEFGHPGAREANVVVYIDTLLSAFDENPPRIYAGGPFSNRAGSAHNDMADFRPISGAREAYWRGVVADLQRQYREGIPALDASAGGDFTAVPGPLQDLFLTADQSGFRDLMFTHAIEGFLANPEYGGNAGLVGWNEIGFPGDAQPRGYTAEQISSGDGLDVIEPTGVVAALLDLLGGA